MIILVNGTPIYRKYWIHVNGKTLAFKSESDRNEYIYKRSLDERFEYTTGEDNTNPVLLNLVLRQNYPTVDALNSVINATLPELKAFLREELRLRCYSSITYGFYSEASGERILYGYNNTATDPDQENMTRMLTAISLGYAPELIAWKGKDTEFKMYTHEQFKQIGQDAYTHENTLKQAYYQLVIQLEAAQTIEDLSDIIWPYPPEPTIASEPDYTEVTWPSRDRAVGVTTSEGLLAQLNADYDRVVLLDSIELTGTCELTKAVILDLNGYELTGEADWLRQNELVTVIDPLATPEEPVEGTEGEGTETPVEGTEGEGTETPIEGTEGEGTETPVEGTETPVEGTETPVEGTETPVEGTDGEGTETPVEGTEGEGTEEEPQLVIVEVATSAEFKRAIEEFEEGQEIQLTDNISLSQAYTVGNSARINLNGYYLMSESNCLRVTDETVHLVILNGTIRGGSGGSYTAVRVDAGTVDLYDIIASVGPDENNEGNSTVYVTGTGVVNIYGEDGYYSTDAAYADKYYVLNKRDGCEGRITVYGGKFEDFDPSQGYEINDDGNFVAPEYTVVALADNIFEVVPDPDYVEA